jgi:hypothetical protein
VGRAIGDTSMEALIVTAVGYGHYGDHAHRLALPLLCAMQQVATAHQVSLRTVGHWIDHEHGLAGRAEADTLAQQFGDAYLGRFASRGVYTEHRMRELGWTDLLHERGIRAYFDHHRYGQHLFSDEVIAIGDESWHTGHGIDVFRRPDAADPGSAS